MPQVAYSASSFSDIIVINRDKIASWTTVGVSAGLTGDNWAGELFVDNLLDEKIELSRTFINDRERVFYGRPMTIGARLSYNFN